MNGWEHVLLKGVSGDECRWAPSSLGSPSIFAAHTPGFFLQLSQSSLAGPISSPHLNFTRLFSLQRKSELPKEQDCPSSEE